MTQGRERILMVERHLARRGIQDERVLDGFRHVAREDFLPPELVEFACRDAPLPTSEGQTVSQPYIVAEAAEAPRLAGHERILEIGTGWGYAAAMLSKLGKGAFTVERHESPATEARERLVSAPERAPPSRRSGRRCRR